MLAAVLAAPAEAQSPSFQKDSAPRRPRQARIVRVAPGPRNDACAARSRWRRLDTADLRAGGGQPGSVCLQLYVVRVPGEDPPDYLVCATPAPDGDELRGRVPRDRSPASRGRSARPP